MTHEFSQEMREKIVYQLAESLDFSSDEYLTKVMECVSIDYARGYLEAYIANARGEEILLLYQIARTISMA